LIHIILYQIGTFKDYHLHGATDACRFSKLETKEEEVAIYREILSYFKSNHKKNNKKPAKSGFFNNLKVFI
jgi:hypothetical protein